MGKLVYLMNVSLDGFVTPPEGGHDWPVVDDELHTWFNGQLRDSAAFLYGRRLYETMVYWKTAESDPGAADVMLDFARSWNARPKIVFSSTLDSVVDGCRLVRSDPVEALSTLRQEFTGELSVGGPTIASAFIRADLVDEYRLELAETRQFASGAMYLGYRRRR